MTLAERFWSKVDRSGESECWPWTGAKNTDGYGIIRGDVSLARAHRVAWELVNGSIPDGMEVCHRCDNPSCCNPAHGFLGTQSDNMHDAAMKGRVAHSENHWNSKLTWPEVQVARKMYATGRVRVCHLSEVLGISEGTVRHFLCGRTWKERSYA